jgi:hypothetical protein
MDTLSPGTWVQLADHPDVPKGWRSTWGRVANVTGDPPRVMVRNALGETVTVAMEHVKLHP